MLSGLQEGNTNFDVFFCGNGTVVQQMNTNVVIWSVRASSTPGSKNVLQEPLMYSLKKFYHSM